MINDSYSYDGYGVMLGDDTTPEPTQIAATNLLYAGEQYDSNLDQYYLRARYYNANNGTFNRVDPYSGNMQDPQSLHKYAYCHNNPVNGIDPTGLFSLAEISIVQAIKTSLRSPRVRMAWKVYNVADVTMEAIQFITQIVMTGSVSPLLVASLLSEFSPLDKIFDACKGLKRLGKGVNYIDDAADGLTDAYKNLGRGRKSVEALGELGTLSVARGHGLEIVNCPRLASNQGIDFIFKNPKTGAYVIAEAKGGTSRLARTVDGAQQMSQTWITKNIDKLRKVDSQLADELAGQAASGALEVMVVSTRIDKTTDAVSTVKSAYLNWNDIGINNFGQPGF